MITGELKNKIDGLWDIFAAGGLSNPLDVIEQMTYLMFIHDLDEMDKIHAKEAIMIGIPHNSIFKKEVQIGDRIVDGNHLRWSVFRDFPAAKMYSNIQENVFPFIKNLHGNKEKYSLILANPPFNGSLDYDIVSTDLLKVCKTKENRIIILSLIP